MDRIELSVFLRHYAVSLREALEAVKSELPAELAEEVTHPRDYLYRIEGLGGNIQRTTEYPILKKLEKLLTTMEDDLTMLTLGPGMSQPGRPIQDYFKND